MPCAKCITKPGYHNFVKFAKVGDADLFYTAPAKTEDFNEDGTKLASIKLHVKEEASSGPWIWVMDCADMQLKHYTEFSFNLGLLSLLNEDPLLKEVWIVRPNIWIRTTIGFLQTFSSAAILRSIKWFDGSNLEIHADLATTGLADSKIHWLISQI
uniref:CRAL-TRIO domain-containing protein n=1 Tax=viral metagenome TaxID=1070528 RepID=A0A6C0DVL2_9ZZZZ